MAMMKRFKPLRLVGTGPIGPAHLRFIEQSKVGRFNASPGIWHPAWQKSAFHAAWQDRISAAMKVRNAKAKTVTKRKPNILNVAPSARRKVLRQSRR